MLDCTASLCLRPWRVDPLGIAATLKQQAFLGAIGNIRMAYGSF